jgi:GalNAc-alpha-(1->4)-GalNAc-alpha-(1->3)-diNAcBac-PP-undecaprenol alpha-1,4-N-acetyl-D-galactosaminyltransferase
VIISLYFFKLENSAGGAERSVIWLSNQLVKHGHFVHLISWDKNNSKTFYTLDKNVIWHKLGLDLNFSNKVRKILRLTSLLKSIKSDVFIGFVMGGDKVVYASSLFSNTKLIAAERNSPVMYSIKLNKFLAFFYLNLFSLANKIVVQFSAYESGYPFYLKKKMVVVANPIVTPKVFSNVISKNNNQYTLLCISRLDNQKNLETLILAFSLLKNIFDNWNLKIIGNGFLKEELQYLINHLALNKRIKILDSKTNISKEYASAHLFCLPSIWEGFPNALAEALAAGLPSVGFSSCDGVNRLIKHRHNGLLVKKNNAEDLARALKVLMKNSSLRLKMSENAKLISSKYQEAIIYKKWETLINKTARNI